MTKIISFIKAWKRNGLITTLSLYSKLFFLNLGLLRHFRFRGKPIFLRKDSSDLAVFRQIMIDGDYDIAFDFEPKVIIDLGANIGISTRHFSEMFKSAKVIALEPDKENYAQLVKNTASEENIKTYNLAIWNKSTSLSLHKEGLGGEWATQVKEESTGTDQIGAISIEDLMALEKIDSIDVIKVDIEGAERELFADAPWLKKIKMIIVETHDLYWSESSNTFIKSLSKLDRFNLFLFGENIVVRNKCVA